MMWKYICPLLLLFVLSACHSKKKVTVEPKPVSTEAYEIPNNLSVSPTFRMFWKDWNNELQQTGVSLDSYIPSDDLVQKYILRQQKGGYSLTGYLHTNTDFNQEQLIKLGGTCVAYGNEMYTFSIPLKELPQFITLPGILSIESAMPAYLRRP